MITAALIIFWLSVGLMFHSYVLYPLLLKLFATGKKPNAVLFSPTDAQLPNIYVVFSVYNEEQVITEKLESIFNTAYPLQKLKVFIGSDNSSDNTNHIISTYTAKHPQLHFTAFNNRNGKSKVINRLMQHIQQNYQPGADDVLVFTDANVMFTPTLFFELAKHFKNPDIALVGANILNKGVKKDGISLQEKTYIQGENQFKYWEGLNWGSMMGAFGACYGMRANCFTTIPDNFLMEDFYLSMNVLKQGKKAISEPAAVCYEDVSNELEQEYKRKSRIQAGNFQNLGVYWPLLFRFNAVSFTFLSHKVIRWLGPVFIMLAYAANICLLNTGRLYLLTFALQTLLLLTPVVDSLFKKLGLHIALLRFVAYFYLMNLALGNGFIMYAKGVKTNAWNPTKRNV